MKTFRKLAKIYGIYIIADWVFVAAGVYLNRSWDMAREKDIFFDNNATFGEMLSITLAVKANMFLEALSGFKRTFTLGD